MKPASRTMSTIPVRANSVCTQVPGSDTDGSRSIERVRQHIGRMRPGQPHDVALRRHIHHGQNGAFT